MKRRYLSAPLLVAALLLTGCGGGSMVSKTVDAINPMNWFGSRSEAPAMAPLPALTQSIQIRTLWQASVGDSGQAIFGPAVVGDSVYAAASDGSIARLNASNGAQVWRINAGERLSGGVGAGTGLVAVGGGNGEVLAFDGNGTALWKAQVSSEVLAAPQVAEGVVVVRSADGRIFGLDAKDGKRKWYYQRSTPALTVRSPVGISIYDGVVYAGFAGGKLVAIALSNGAVRWEATVALPRGTTELERVTDVIGLPVVEGREVCAVAYQGRIGCFDMANGQPLWGRAMSSTSGLALDVSYAYVSDDKGAVHALDRSSGTSLWRQDKLSLRNLSAPFAYGREIVVADIQGYVHFLARDSGAFVGRMATDGSPVSTNPVSLPGGGFLIQTRKGGLYAFSTQ
ncbi:MAG: outer membrane protein assembly factor BamB [Burkholderiales bacterium]|nr:outer membrane protein assembly factor BamB [Burkholderiales bacterium]